MSVQAGIWNFDGKPVDRKLLGEFSEALQQQGPDGEYRHVDGSVALLYRPFHTTAESRREKQPYVSHRGFVITWDGRLDNREELAFDLGHDVTADDTDVALLAAAFDRWESACFRRIIGDWAVSIWKPQYRELIFACDFMAIRHVFYYIRHDCVWWSTDVTPLVLLSGDKFHVDDEYIAGYFAHDPEAHLTPYREIRQVPPGQSVRVCDNRAHVERYWKFSPRSRIRYKTDAEYEEHFRHVFRQSVGRRLRSDSPILAELSGGLDSSSIVCMADDILSKQAALTPRLDTLSYYDKTEPNGDDWIYFPIVERNRGRAGRHIDAATLTTVAAGINASLFNALPGSLAYSSGLNLERAHVITQGKYRVVLSGLGGDELMGGIPNPSAHLGDLIVQFRLIQLSRQLIAWSLAKRKPFLRLLREALLDMLPVSIRRQLGARAKAEAWIQKDFGRKWVSDRLMHSGQYSSFMLPTRRAYVAGVILMANKLAKYSSSTLAVEEARYPFLDQNLLHFMLSIPASQLLRPGERRSLMRRALAPIVPQEILGRRTKQFGVRTPVIAIENQREELKTAFRQPISSSLGYVDPAAFLEAVRSAAEGKPVHIVHLGRTISLELWLRELASRELIYLRSEAPSNSGSPAVKRAINQSP